MAAIMIAVALQAALQVAQNGGHADGVRLRRQVIEAWYHTLAATDAGLKCLQRHPTPAWMILSRT